MSGQPTSRRIGVLAVALLTAVALSVVSAIALPDASHGRTYAAGQADLAYDYDAPPASTTPSSNTCTAVTIGERVDTGVLRSSMSSSGRFLATKGGRGRNKLRFDPKAGGDHTTFRRGPDGRVTHYQDWHQNPRNPSGFDPGRRFDGEGRAHGPVATPHMHERDGGITGRDDIDPSDLPPGY